MGNCYIRNETARNRLAKCDEAGAAKAHGEQPRTSREGKPDPSCYRLGAERLGKSAVDPSRILVLEDSPAGVRAGKACWIQRYWELATTHDPERLREAGADWIVRDMRSE